MTLTHRRSFWLGVAAALGALFAGTVLATAGTTERLVAAAPATVKLTPRPLAVLDRPRQQRDELPPALRNSVGGLEGDASVAEQLRPGRIQPETSRVLLTGMGARRASLYAFKSSKGKVCFALTAGPDGCLDGFAENEPLAWTRYDFDARGSGSPTTLVGLAQNDVKAVRVVIDGAEHDAQFANNAFFFELPNTQFETVALVAVLKNRSSKMIVLPPSPW